MRTFWGPACLPLCLLFSFTVGLAACSSDSICDLEPEFEVGDDGHANPLSASASEARAGRLVAGDMPEHPLAQWRAGDFVLANDKVALLIEDAGPSNLYDPWGGRPVGAMRVDNGALVEPSDFVEIMVFTGRESLVTETVSVLNDGSDGQAAIVRAAGFLAPTPAFESLTQVLLDDTYGDIPTAIDYVLEPDSESVDIYVVHNCAREVDTLVSSVVHAFMFETRMPGFIPDKGFEAAGEAGQYVAFIDEDATSLAYRRFDEPLQAGFAAAGFVANFSDGFELPACAQTRRHHARLTIGGPGLDGLVQAVARDEGTALRTISGTVRDSLGNVAQGVRVHAESAAHGYLTRTTTDALGQYTLSVPANDGVQLTAYRRGDALVGPEAVGAAASSRDFTLPGAADILVTIVEAGSGRALPARVQLLPANTTTVPSVPAYFGEPEVTRDRLQVFHSYDGQAVLRAPVGDWRLVVSRGFEYEIHDEVLSVIAGETRNIVVELDHVVETTDVMCADFHIHTFNSPDAPDDGHRKIRGAVADGLEIPVRSDHDYVNGFEDEIADLGIEDFAYSVTSVELTTLLTYGHFGVFPLQEDPAEINNGAPQWMRFPSLEDPSIAVEMLEPTELLESVRARPDDPAIIVNHPRGSTNYFDYVGYDPETGTASRPQDWDEEFILVEVFNDSGWERNRDGTVKDWLSFLKFGRPVFAVGSSDSHYLSSSPIGYPRTCLRVGTDSTSGLTPGLIKNTASGGHATIVGGIYVDANVAGAGPGDTAMGLGATATLHVRVQAPSWIQVDTLEIIVDGETLSTLAIEPSDADPSNPTIRYEDDILIDVASAGGFVIVAATGPGGLEPVHPSREAFGVTNPIFLQR